MDIHRCRFIPYNPQAINSLAFSHPPSSRIPGGGAPTLRLAIGRANGDIEIWNPMRGAWFQETILRGGKDRSIEGLAWTMDPAEDGPEGTKLPGRLRLFSIGYSSAVTEWDLGQGRAMRHSAGNYGEIWCLAPQPQWQPTQGKDGKWLPPAEGEFTGQNLAAGCADGSIVILSTADGDLKYQRLMRPSTKRARVLSVTFQNRNTVVAGYADSAIRLFDIRSGQLLRTISLGKGPSGGPKELLVWSVKCLPDGTIVSGDSAGEIRFWDAKNYSLIQRIQGHLADTLDVAVSSAGDTVVSGGADQRTVVYRKKEGDKNDKRSRWAEVMHRRYHTHDVKTFAVYETKDISIVVSGGPDATPVVLPLREFGKEHHRRLSSLPQCPQLASSPSSRLVMSFWDREVSIWRVLRGPTSEHDNIDGKRHRLVAKVLIQGEENITSAMLSPDGKILAVATISEIKVFYVRRRKGDERGTLRIQKLDLPPAVSNDGARLVAISPDTKWLCVIRPNSEIYLLRIMFESAHEKPEILPRLTKLKRSGRPTRFEKASHGTLGEYERTIRSVAFSEDSKIFAAGDLAGCVDTFVAESAVDSVTKAFSKAENPDSDDDEPDGEDPDCPFIDGYRWQPGTTESPIPRLHSGVVLLSFRPKSPAEQKRLANGTHHTLDDSPSDTRLMVVTSEHQIVEFDALEGKMTDWSKRNPKAYLPPDFRDVKARAMGCLWELAENRERLWLYGSSWLWMFDLQQDFPSTTQSHKRKRSSVEDNEYARKKKPNSGAGDRMSKNESALFIGSHAVRQTVGHDGSKSERIAVDTHPKPTGEGGEEEEEEYDDETVAENHEAKIAQLRRHDPETSKRQPKNPPSQLMEPNGLESTSLTDDYDIVNSPKEDKGAAEAEAKETSPPRRWWRTYKYRDILGIVPLSPFSDNDGVEQLKNADVNKGAFEVAVVERPMWDVELPGRYLRDYE
ncbi:hypothetical protein PHISCL_00528 [Aspergillus sclerotialis]|uniref:Uncharacterized protein n=1 Tax=Aspergillus sclerotialis TaxID=2070753 RepID=A0A3A3AB25_9EURO|nr:hypothetical protein PHISCL_00528 [Aspergillus sclerotialis]